MRKAFEGNEQWMNALTKMQKTGDTKAFVNYMRMQSLGIDQSQISRLSKLNDLIGQNDTTSNPLSSMS